MGGGADGDGGGSGGSMGGGANGDGGDEGRGEGGGERLSQQPPQPHPSSVAALQVNKETMALISPHVL
eukprot:6552731-Prymnesium_polylepis.1